MYKNIPPFWVEARVSQMRQSPIDVLDLRKFSSTMLHVSS